MDNSESFRTMVPTRATRRTRLVSNQNAGTSVNKEYRYGEYFFYGHEYKNHEHYVQSKYKTMVKELTQNKFYPITMKQWHQTKHSAQSFLYRMKRECSTHNLDRQQCFNKFGIHLTARHHRYYNQRFGIRAGQEINPLHLIALKLFFNDGNLSSAIRKTYWGLDENDHFNDIKERHSHFVIVCQRILEAIYLYGAPLTKDMSVYRGVTQQTFAWFDAKWSGPVSTSLDFRVARRFTGTTGSVVKLVSTEMDEMYIYGGGGAKIKGDDIEENEYSLSNFDEKECLMWAPCLTIIDVPFSRNRKQHDIAPYIAAMRLFQKIVSGHLFSRSEKHLLSVDVQNKLHALVDWKLMKNDEKLMQCIQCDVARRTKAQDAEIGENDEQIVSHSRLSQRSLFKEEGEDDQDEKEAFASPHLQTAKFIKSLCGAVFEHLLKTTNMLWTNPDIELQENLTENVQKLFDSNTSRHKCHILKWIVAVEELRNAPYLNEDYLVINGYLREQMPHDKNMVNLLLNCDEIMDSIGHYYEDKRAALDFKVDWKCQITYGENDICELNPVVVILPSSFRANNKFYDMEIQIEGDMNTIPEKEHLMWSVDILCDQLDICMHFVDQNVSKFRNRRYAQIAGMSNREIQQFIKKEQDIVWKIAFRFYYEHDMKQIDMKQESIHDSEPLQDDKHSEDPLDEERKKCSVDKKQINFDLFIKRKVEDWLRCKLLQTKSHMISANDGGGAGNNDNYRKANEGNERSNESNERNNGSESNDQRDNNHDNGNYGHSGSGSDDGDDDKHNDDDDDDDAMDDDKEDDDEEEDVPNEEELDRFFTMFTNIQDLDAMTLQKQVHSFSDIAKMRNDLSNNIKMLNLGLNRLNNAINGRNTTSICYPKACAKPKSSKSVAKQHMNYRHRAYFPSKTKSKYKWDRRFTQQIIPKKILQPLDIGDGAVYEFMVKALGINKDRYYEQGAIRVFNLGLHQKETKQNVYFIAQRIVSSRYYAWKMHQILSENEIITMYGIPPHVLPVPVAIEGISEMKEVEEAIRKSIHKIIQNTKWTKIPIYNKRDKLHNIRRMTLSLDKPKFIKLYQQYAQQNAKPQSIPIIMFDANDGYLVEYVCIVSLEQNVDIGVSFEYNKVTKKVKVVGIYLDKEVILRQHQIVYPLHNNYSLLANFRSEITDLYIGNPDDQRNHINALKQQLEKLQQSKPIPD